MPSSDLIEIQANALALAVLLLALAKGKEEDEIEKITYLQTHKDFLNQPIANMTRQSIYKMVDLRMEEGYLYRMDRLEQTAESHDARIKQLEVNRQPPKICSRTQVRRCTASSKRNLAIALIRLLT